MKKILNEPYAYVDEMLIGLCAAHPEYYQKVGETGRVIKRPEAPIPGKVGIVTGGGSGHLPVFTGYVGPGLLDGAAIGDVFASPACDEMVEAMRAASGGKGVLRLYGNYGGDVMNFDMAGEMVEMEDIPSTTVVLTDDVASAPPEEKEKRRGVAGMVYAFKIAGAMPPRPVLDLEEVTRVGAECRRRLPLDGRGPDVLHGAAGRQADLRDCRRRDGNGHGHPRRARRLARQAADKATRSPPKSWIKLLADHAARLRATGFPR